MRSTPVFHSLENFTWLKGETSDSGDRRLFARAPVAAKFSCPVLALACVLLLCASPHSILAQAVNGTLVGTISDTSGALVSGARVTLTDVNTSISRSTQTDAQGYYSFPDVTPGTYKVAAEMHGSVSEG